MWWRRTYGASPLHLLVLLASFALAGYVAVQARRGPLPARMLVWFIGAVIAHDLVLFPLYALADRSLRAALPGNRRRLMVAAHALNYLRVPALLSGLLLLMFYPVIFQRSTRTYRAASGLGLQPYFGRWLLITGVLFGLSAVLFALRAGAGRRRRPAAASPAAPPAGR